MKIITTLGVAALLAAGATLPTHAATTIYGDRAAFAAQLGASVTDDYENPGYVFQQDDAQMSAVIGETTYTATEFPDTDFVVPFPDNHFYCAGCNGSFQLGFGGASVASGGVFGAGFDLIINVDFDALVTFADGSSADYVLPTGPDVFPTPIFWGITSDLGIVSINLGVAGEPSFDGTLGIDNLQIGAAGSGGSAPEPTTWALVLAGFGGIGGVLRQRRGRAALVAA